MSTQRTLTESYDDDPPDGQGGANTAAWTPGGHDRQLDGCQRCGSHVTKRFRRVNGDSEGAVFGCPQCYAGVALKRGAVREGCDGEREVHVGVRG